MPNKPTPYTNDIAYNIFLEANQLSKEQHFKSAIRLYQNAISLSVCDSEFVAKASSHCAYAYCAIENFDKAIEFCNNAIKLKPDYASAYSNRAYALYKKNPKIHAYDILCDFTKARNFRPSSKAVINNLSWALKNPYIYRMAGKYFSDTLYLVDGSMHNKSKQCQTHDIKNSESVLPSVFQGSYSNTSQNDSVPTVTPSLYQYSSKNDFVPSQELSLNSTKPQNEFIPQLSSYLYSHTTQDDFAPSVDLTSYSPKLQNQFIPQISQPSYSPQFQNKFVPSAVSSVKSPFQNKVEKGIQSKFELANSSIEKVQECIDQSRQVIQNMDTAYLLQKKAVLNLSHTMQREQLQAFQTIQHKGPRPISPIYQATKQPYNFSSLNETVHLDDMKQNFLESSVVRNPFIRENKLRPIDSSMQQYPYMKSSLKK